MAKTLRLKQDLGTAIADAITDTSADRQSIKIRPATADRLEGTGKLRGAMMLPVSRLASDPGQPRKEFDAQALDRLAASIRGRGVLQPIRVRWDEPRGSWVIVAGERRWRACLLLGIDQIPAVEASLQTPDEVLADQLVENVLREDLSPVEQGRAIRTLLDRTGWSQARVSEELGISPGQVSKVLSLLKVPEPVQAKVEAGEMSVAAAVDLKRVEPERAVEIAEIGGDTRTIQAAVRRSGARTASRTSRHEYREDDASVIVVIRRPNAKANEFAQILENALTQCRSGL